MVSRDSVNYREEGKKGNFSVNARMFLMHTVNNGALTDHAALGIGAGLKYETPAFKGFRFGVGGFATYNMASTDLEVKDPLSGAANRYEIGIFNITDAGNKSNMYRLEELYLKYTLGKTSILLGRQFLKTPFINLQDGRMRPTAEEGIWVSKKDTGLWEFRGGWLWKISPRSTTKWYSVSHSIGIYPSGVDISGNPSSYYGNIKSSGIGMVGVKFKKNTFSLEVWEVFIENLFNTVMLQPELKWQSKPGGVWQAGAQLIFQNGTGNGGNPDPLKSYTGKESKALIFSSKFGYSMKKIETQINYTRITRDGRYLMPREWGREPFYTFMPRERNEGFGDVDAVSVTFQYKPAKGTEYHIGYGHFYLPDVTNYRLNKYGMPSYNQLNIGVNKELSNFIRGLEIQFLLVYKGRLGETYSNFKYIDNKVNMFNGNLLFNYRLN